MEEIIYTTPPPKNSEDLFFFFSTSLLYFGYLACQVIFRNQAEMYLGMLFFRYRTRVLQKLEGNINSSKKQHSLLNNLPFSE